MPVITTKEGRKYYFDKGLIPFYGTPVISGVNLINEIYFNGHCQICQKETQQVQLSKTVINGHEIKVFCLECRQLIINEVGK